MRYDLNGIVMTMASMIGLLSFYYYTYFTAEYNDEY